MYSISVDRLGKRYRLGKSSWWAWSREVARRLGLRSGDQQVGWAARELWALKEVSFGVQPGTVLGIIKAFADLAHNQAGGITVVMTGIAEALVATALGLLVAIPAVIAFNAFQGRIRRILGRVDAAANLVLVALSTADTRSTSKGPNTDKATVESRG